MGCDCVSELQPPTDALFIPQRIYCYGDVGMILTGENQRNRWKTFPGATCPPRILRGLTQTRTQASVVWGRLLITWTVFIATMLVRPLQLLLPLLLYIQLYTDRCSSDVLSPSKGFSNRGSRTPGWSATALSEVAEFWSTNPFRCRRR
jgi:hypothetical protein